MKLYTYTVTIDDVERDILSFTEPDTAFSKGLANKSIVGYLKEREAEVHPDNIIYNPDFVELFVRTVKSTALATEELMKAAIQQRNGFIYIVDQRTREQNETKSKDILGSFEVTDGNLNADSFQFNPNYQIISSDGLFKLPDNFEKAILDEIGE